MCEQVECAQKGLMRMVHKDFLACLRVVLISVHVGAEQSRKGPQSHPLTEHLRSFYFQYREKYLLFFYTLLKALNA